MELEVTFCKKGDMKYISHLDIVRLFQRAVRRAKLPVKLSEGYTAHYKIKFSDALKLGVESEGEKAVFVMDRWIDVTEFENKMNGQLPEGIGVIQCKKRF